MMTESVWSPLVAHGPLYIALMAFGVFFLSIASIQFGGWRSRAVGHRGVTVSFFVILVALLVAAMPDARAQSADRQGFQDQGAAWSACMAASNAQWPGSSVRCRPGSDSCIGYGLGSGTCSNYQKCLWDANNGYSCDNYWFGYPQAATCATRPDEYTWAPPGGVAGGNVCSQGCTYTYVLDASAGNFFSPTGTTCTTTDAPEPVIDTDGDGVPDEQDAFPNDPNESADSDGDGIGDNADVAPDDPTNGDDDGEGNEADNSAGGGGTCDAPPSCEGDGIACNTNYQIWRARCAAEGLGGKVTGDPTNCNAGYTCENNAVACAQVAVMRAQLCNGTGDGENGPGDGSVSGGGSCSAPYVCTGGDPIACASLREQHSLKCALMDMDGADDMGQDHAPGDFIGVSEDGALLDIDFGGFLGGRGACPISEFPQAMAMPANFLSGMCSGLDVWYVIVMVMTGIHCSAIIGRAVTAGG